jgi:tripartite-type tricarboxylate transporter receptor subunit TctC
MVTGRICCTIGALPRTAEEKPMPERPGPAPGAVPPARRAVLALPALLLPASSRAQDGAARPITLVVPFPAGSVTDSVARAVATPLQELLGQVVVVDNRPGAQGTLAAAHVARSQPDGTTLLVGSSVMFVARSLIRGLPYDPVESFQPISGIGATSMMIMVPAASPIHSPGELQTRAKRAPPVTIGYGSPSGQVALALFATASGTQPVGVSYRGIPQAMSDLVGGHIEAAVVDLGTGLAQQRSGGVRALAISAASRSPLMPEVPTLQESFPAAEGALETIIAVLGPAQTPPAMVARLDKAIRGALARPSLQERFGLLSTSPLPLETGSLAARIRTDNARWEALIRLAGIEPE